MKHSLMTVFFPSCLQIGNSCSGLPGCLGDIYTQFEKEDMSEMFRRAFLEQMGNIDEPDRAMFDCHVCGDKCRGRAITAMARYAHCFTKLRKASF